MKQLKGEKKDNIDRKRFGKESRNVPKKVEVKCVKDTYTKKDKSVFKSTMVVGQTYYVSEATAKLLKDKGLV